MSKTTVRPKLRICIIPGLLQIGLPAGYSGGGLGLGGSLSNTKAPGARLTNHIAAPRAGGNTKILGACSCIGLAFKKKSLLGLVLCAGAGPPNMGPALASGWLSKTIPFWGLYCGWEQVLVMGILSLYRAGIQKQFLLGTGVVDGNKFL